MDEKQKALNLLKKKLELEDDPARRLNIELQIENLEQGLKLNQVPNDKYQQLRIALALCGIAITPQVAIIILMVMKKIEEKGDDFSIKDVAKIEAELIQK